MDKTVKTDKPKSAVRTETPWVEWFADDFYPAYAKQIWVAAGVLVAAVFLYFAWSSQNEHAALKANKALGDAYVFLSQDKLPEAEKALNDVLGDRISGMARDKANLFLGKVYYDEQKYDQALEAYGKVGKGNKNTLLIHTGALHGIAACYMQKKDYAKAAQVLDDFLAEAMRRTGNPKENLAGEEVADASPSIPNALWKQALCYRELKENDKVKATVEKLRKSYPASSEAQNGARLLALIE